MIAPRSIGYLTLSGELDGAARKGLTAAFEPLAETDVAIIDFAEVTYCDSSAINCLVTLRKHMLGAGRRGDVRIVRPTQAVRRVLEICGLDDLLAIHDSLLSAGLTAKDGDSVVTFVGNHDAGRLISE